MNISIIGAGVGDTKNLTCQAAEKIENADIIIGAKRVIEPFAVICKKVFYEYNAEKIVEIIKNNPCDNAAVLFSGDISFFSGAKKLCKIYPDAQVIPGISCVSYFCSKVGIPYDDMNIISMHGRKCNIVSEVRTHRNTFVLLGENPCRRLSEFNLADVRVYIGERLSYTDEKIMEGSAADFADMQLNPLSVMIIENPNYSTGLKIGISDCEFIRGDVPMTKSEVRCVSISKLNIADDDICWDIGAGTGSVTVEMAFLCPRGTVYAIEKNSAAAELIRLNCRKFKTDNVIIKEINAPKCLDGIEAPDKVFIGGSSGNMRGIIETALVKNKDVRFVINAIALETLSEAVHILEDMNMEFEVSQISAARNKKAGKFNLMTGMNPVFIISAKRN